MHGFCELNEAEWDLILCNTMSWVETNPNTTAHMIVIAIASNVVSAVHAGFSFVIESQVRLYNTGIN